MFPLLAQVPSIVEQSTAQLQKFQQRECARARRFLRRRPGRTPLLGGTGSSSGDCDTVGVQMCDVGDATHSPAPVASLGEVHNPGVAAGGNDTDEQQPQPQQQQQQQQPSPLKNDEAVEADGASWYTLARALDVLQAEGADMVGAADLQRAMGLRSAAAAEAVFADYAHVQQKGDKG